MKSNNHKILILVCGLGLIAIIVFIFIINPNLSRSKSLNEVRTETVPTDYPAYDVPRVSAEEAWRVFDEGNGIIIDVRSSEAYDQAHTVGAVSAPLVSEGDYSVDAPQDALLFLYCT